MTESQIEAWLGKRLRELKCLYYKFVSPGNDGVPDRIIVLPLGRIIFLELKTEEGRLTAMQEYSIDKLQRQGCTVQTCYGMDDARQLVDDIKIMMEARNAI